MTKKKTQPEENVVAIQIPAVLEGISRLKDGGLSMRFGTNEVSNEELITVNKHYQKFGWLLFRPNQFKLTDVPIEDADLEGKSQSQRFRAVLFVLWKHYTDSHKTDLPFDEFYRLETEKVITHFKSKLPPQ